MCTRTRAARGKNTQQLLSFMARTRWGMPVIVMGDTNFRYTATNFRYTTIGEAARLLPAAGFADAWRGGADEGVALTCPFPLAAGLSAAAALASCEVVERSCSATARPRRLGRSSCNR